MAAPIRKLLVRLDPERIVFFVEPGEDLALFSRAGFHFPKEVVESIAAGGVIASLGPSTSSNVRRLRLRDSAGRLIFNEPIVVYLN
ncbi:MAG: hypothetical protein M3S32_11115 [Acidobacteriota bacterium]|nr:hypothetical protein [Acidobacteriota bacterium]